jgi:hypothetical protein
MVVGFIAPLRSLCLPIVPIAAALIAVQALFAGFATGRAAVILEPGQFDITVMCHGGDSDPTGGPAPDPIDPRHLCCMACAAGPPPATLPKLPLPARADACRSLTSPLVPADHGRIVLRAMRAGLSQAPPSIG